MGNEHYKNTIISCTIMVQPLTYNIVMLCCTTKVIDMNTDLFLFTHPTPVS